MNNDSGLICAYVLDGKGGATPLDWKGVSGWNPGQGTLWVHLDHAAEDSRQWIRHSSGLDEAVADSLLARETRPRSLDLVRGFLVLLRGVNLNPGHDPEDMVSIRIWVEPNRVISSRHRKLRAVDDMRRLIEGGEAPTDAAGLFALLAQRLADQMEPVLDNLEAEISQFEDEMNRAGGWNPRRRAGRPRLGELQRDAIAIRRYLAPQHRALAAFDDDGFTFLSEVHRMSLRETEDRIIRYTENLTALIERATALQEQITGDLADRMNRTMYILSLVAAIFLPLGYITDLFGTNLGGAPGVSHPYGFEILVSVQAGLVLLVLLVFRWLKWL